MEHIFDQFKGLGPARLGTLVSMMFVCVGFLVFIATKITSKEYALLYSQLEDEEMRKVTKALAEKGIQFKVNNETQDIMVPEELKDDLRIELTEDGVVDLSVGYEIFDKDQSLGTSNFLNEVNRLRALEGELSKTIGGFKGIRTARVHLVLPKRELFSKAIEEPSASVTLHLDSRKAPSDVTIRAIQQTVAASVPRLSPQMVVISDSFGRLLASLEDDQAQMQMDNLRDLQLKQERQMAAKIENLLESTLGIGRVRAEVKLDMDFSATEINDEVFNPDGSVLRSNETIEETSQASDVDNSVTVGNNVPDQPNPFTGDQLGRTENSQRTSERNNFEITTSKRRKVVSPGEIERISVAVLVDGRGGDLYDPKNQPTGEWQPLPEEEIQQIEELVKSAIGFDDVNRGDTIRIINMPFQVPEVFGEVEEEKILGLASRDMKKLIELFVLSLVGVLVMLLVIRPMLQRVLESTVTGDGKGKERQIVYIMDEDGRQVPAKLQADGTTTPLSQEVLRRLEQGESLSDIDIEEPKTELERILESSQYGGDTQQAIAKINEVINSNPNEAVTILRQWIGQDADA